MLEEIMLGKEAGELSFGLHELVPILLWVLVVPVLFGIICALVYGIVGIGSKVALSERLARWGTCTVVHFMFGLVVLLVGVVTVMFDLPESLLCDAMSIIIFIMLSMVVIIASFLLNFGPMRSFLSLVLVELTYCLLLKVIVGMYSGGSFIAAIEQAARSMY